jgi:hypothetical protein
MNTRQKTVLGRYISEIKYERVFYEVTYVGGDVCKESEDKEYSAKVTYLCDKEEKRGWPEYKGQFKEKPC